MKKSLDDLYQRCGENQKGTQINKTDDEVGEEMALVGNDQPKKGESGTLVMQANAQVRQNDRFSKPESWDLKFQADGQPQNFKKLREMINNRGQSQQKRIKEGRQVIEENQFVWNGVRKDDFGSNGGVDRKRDVDGQSPFAKQRHSNALMFSFENHDFIKVLGQGSFSTICLARCSKTKVLHAIKVFKSKSDDIDNEFAVLQQLDHPNVIKTYGLLFDNVLKRKVLLMEYANGRTLKEIQTLNNPQIFSEESTVEIFGQILEAIAYVHGLGMAHCDLKLENIIVTRDTNTVKIIDFGFSKLSQNGLVNSICGSMGYMSPQLLRKSKHSLFKDDVWALGIILFKMMFNFFPFRGKNENEILMRIDRYSISLPSNIKTSQKMIRLVNVLLNPKECDRPTAQEALELFRKSF